MIGQETFFERLAREQGVTEEEVLEIISARIRQGLHDPDPKKRERWERIPCAEDIPTPEEWLRYAVEKLEVEGKGEWLRWYPNL